MRSVEKIERIKESYLPGMRIRLIKMDDFQAPPVGTEGTIRGVDDIGSVMVAWDNGSSLSVALGEDEIELVSKPITNIYTAYSKEADITFIMEDNDKTTRVAGFYYGEPDDKATKIYYGKLVAEFE